MRALLRLLIIDATDDDEVWIDVQPQFGHRLQISLLSQCRCLDGEVICQQRDARVTEGRKVPNNLRGRLEIVDQHHSGAYALRPAVHEHHGRTDGLEE